MLLRAGFYALAAIFVCVSVCSALKCTGGVYKSVNDRCELYCGEKEKCICAKDENPSNVDGCLQKCQPTVPNNPNITVDQCLDMDCSGLDNCFQVCSNKECQMQCKSTRVCSQECNSGNCTKLVCSGPQCNQQCKGCTMECTAGVKECVHQCLGGTCRSICAADKCSATCNTNKGEDCKIISSGEKLTISSLGLFIGFLAYVIY